MNNRPISRKYACSVALGIAALCAAQPGQALTINVLEFLDGEVLPVSGATAGSAPTLAGGGTLASIMASAATYWESIILDVGTLNIGFGWAALGGGTLATATQFVSPRDFSGAGRVGDIRFDNDGSSSFFADHDVTTAETYATVVDVSADLGGGEMNVGAGFTDPIGLALGQFDLFSTAIHEIGHLLGLANLSQPIDAAFGVGQINITSGVFAGASLDLTTAGGGHLDGGTLPFSLMQPTTGGDRRLASEADIAAIAEFSGFTNIDYAAATFGPPPPTAVVPLPAAGLLLAGALGGLGMAAARRRRRKAA